MCPIDVLFHELDRGCMFAGRYHNHNQRWCIFLFIFFSNNVLYQSTSRLTTQRASRYYNHLFHHRLSTAIQNQHTHTQDTQSGTEMNLWRVPWPFHLSPIVSSSSLYSLFSFSCSISCILFQLRVLLFPPFTSSVKR